MKTSELPSVNMCSSTTIGPPPGQTASVKKSLTGLAERGLAAGAARAAKAKLGLFGNRLSRKQGSPAETPANSTILEGDLATHEIRHAVGARQIAAAERPAADFRDHGVLGAVREVMLTNPVFVDLVVSHDSPTSAQSAAVAGAEMLFENGLISHAQFEDLLRGAAANVPTTFAPVSDSF
jgi:hypothetical protein